MRQDDQYWDSYDMDEHGVFDYRAYNIPSPASHPVPDPVPDTVNIEFDFDESSATHVVHRIGWRGGGTMLWGLVGIFLL